MNTYFIDTKNVEDSQIRITGDLFRHLSKVLRIQVGEHLHFSDNIAHTYDGKVKEITKDYILTSIDLVQAITGEPPLMVYLIQCLPRGDKMDQIIQKTTELGVGCILPVESDNSQIRLKNKAKEKAARYGKIAAAAAEQCGRGKIPEIVMANSLERALKYLPDDTKVIFCYEKEGKNSLKSELIKIRDENIAVVIGPEGGFSSGEAQSIIARGGVPVTMGPRILRAETAGPCALAAIMYEKGDWGCRIDN